jgi:hypothetical protein
MQTVVLPQTGLRRQRGAVSPYHVFQATALRIEFIMAGKVDLRHVPTIMPASSGNRGLAGFRLLDRAELGGGHFDVTHVR